MLPALARRRHTRGQRVRWEELHEVVQVLIVDPVLAPKVVLHANREGEEQVHYRRLLDGRAGVDFLGCEGRTGVSHIYTTILASRTLDVISKWVIVYWKLGIKRRPIVSREDIVVGIRAWGLPGT
jgi:hypothetical protein